MLIVFGASPCGLKEAATTADMASPLENDWTIFHWMTLYANYHISGYINFGYISAGHYYMIFVDID